MDDRLGKLDRATLVFWRVSNVAGWFLAATAAHLVLRFAEAELGQRYGIFGSVRNAIAAVVVALAVGGIAGAKVWRRHEIVAGVAASPALLESPAWGVVTIALALLWSRVVAGWQKL